MFIPPLKDDTFNRLKSTGLATISGISSLNRNNVKGKFTTNLPNGISSAFVIRNHKGRYKYFPITVDRGIISGLPELIWCGYIYHDGVWYFASTDNMLRLHRGEVLGICQVVETSMLEQRGGITEDTRRTGPAPVPPVLTVPPTQLELEGDLEESLLDILNSAEAGERGPSLNASEQVIRVTPVEPTPPLMPAISERLVLPEPPRTLVLPVPPLIDS